MATVGVAGMEGPKTKGRGMSEWNSEKWIIIVCTIARDGTAEQYSNSR